MIGDGVIGVMAAVTAVVVDADEIVVIFAAAFGNLQGVTIEASKGPAVVPESSAVRCFVRCVDITSRSSTEGDGEDQFNAKWNRSWRSSGIVSLLSTTLPAAFDLLDRCRSFIQNSECGMKVFNPSLLFTGLRCNVVGGCCSLNPKKVLPGKEYETRMGYPLFAFH